MPRPTKYVPGAQITSIQHLIDVLLSRRWVYYKGHPKHPQFLMNMALTVLYGAVQRGKVHEALPNPAYRSKELPF